MRYIMIDVLIYYGVIDYMINVLYIEI